MCRSSGRCWSVAHHAPRATVERLHDGPKDERAMRSSDDNADSHARIRSPDEQSSRQMERCRTRPGSGPAAAQPPPCSEPVRGTETQPSGALTPELVLVSPDLAPMARALLPDRPWESLYFPTPSRTASGAERVAPRTLRSDLSAEPFSTTAFLDPARDRRALGRCGRTCRDASSSASALPPRDAPSSADRTVTTRAGPRPRIGLSRPQKGTHAPATWTAVPTTTKKRTADDPVAMLYIRVNRGGRTIARFDDVLRCAGKVTLSNIAIGSDGRFRVKRQLWSGRRSVVISLNGSMDEKTRSSGTRYASPARNAIVV